MGFDIDLMTEIAKQLGVKLERVDMPFTSLIAGVQQGKIDAVISSMNYIEERTKQVTFKWSFRNELAQKKWLAMRIANHFFMKGANCFLLAQG